MSEELMTNSVSEEEQQAPAVEVEAEKQSELSICTKCGMEVPAGMKFCPNCGKQCNELGKKNFVKNMLKKKPILIGAATVVPIKNQVKPPEP